MASKQTYECYVCKRNGFENVRVFLDGKTEDGKTIYKNEDMSAHQHKTKQQQEAAQLPEQQQQRSTTIVTEPTSIKIINAKLDRIIALLDSKAKQQ